MSTSPTDPQTPAKLSGSRIDALMLHLQQEPDSLDLRYELLMEFLSDSSYHADPRRIESIAWFVQHHPNDPASRCPMVAVNPQTAAAEYAQLLLAWSEQLGAQPDDIDIARGAARFLAASDREAALRLLDERMLVAPECAVLCLDAGLIAPDSRRRFHYFRRARELGSTHPNLLAWLALSAANSGELAMAGAVGDEMLQLAENARKEIGDLAEWQEEGPSLWRHVMQANKDSVAASRIVSLHSSIAYWTHTGHTANGLVALAKGDDAAAIDHLIASAQVRPDHRLSAYGPNIELVRCVCERGHWVDAARFLDEWMQRSPHDDVARWQNDVSAQRLPEP